MANEKSTTRATYHQEWYLRRRREMTPEQLAEWWMKRREANQRYCQRNRDRALEVARKSRAKHKEQRLQNAREWRANNKERVAQYNRLWSQANAEKGPDRRVYRRDEADNQRRNHLRATLDSESRFYYEPDLGLFCIVGKYMGINPVRRWIYWDAL